MTPARLLMTTDAVGGVWTYAVDLAAMLARDGTEVVLAALGPEPDEAQRQQALAIPGLLLVTLPGKLEWMAEPEADLQRQGEQLMALERDVCPDMVHLNGYAQGALPWRAPTLLAAHSCVWSWFRAVRGEEPPHEWRGYIERVRRGLNAAGVVVAPSRAFLAEIEALYRPRVPCRAILNGRDASGFASTAKEPFILAAGRLWDEAKNVSAVIRVAGRLDWLVAIAGPLAGRKPRAAVPLGTLSPAEMASWMGRASIFAAPARYEPFGLTVLEAALSGCALVLGDIPSQRELWHDAAIFVPPDDDRRLQTALAALIADAPRRQDLAARARRRALRYSARAMAAGYRAAYAVASERHRALPKSA